MLFFFKIKENYPRYFQSATSYFSLLVIVLIVIKKKVKRRIKLSCFLLENLKLKLKVRFSIEKFILVIERSSLAPLDSSFENTEHKYFLFLDFKMYIPQHK